MPTEEQDLVIDFWVRVYSNFIEVKESLPQKKNHLVSPTKWPGKNTFFEACNTRCFRIWQLPYIKKIWSPLKCKFYIRALIWINIFGKLEWDHRTLHALKNYKLILLWLLLTKEIFLLYFGFPLQLESNILTL